MSTSPQQRDEILGALRMGRVPQDGLDCLAVGLGSLEESLDEDLRRVQHGGSAFKAIRGNCGCGKTFLARWLQQRARQLQFATAEVQVSETETPLHRLEVVYRRVLERLSTPSIRQSAFRSVIKGWFCALEKDVLSAGAVDPNDALGILTATNRLMEKRLARISKAGPAFASALRAYRAAIAGGYTSTADGLLAWLAGQPNVAASIQCAADIQGEVDHSTALNFLQALLLVLRDSGHPGLILVLDDVDKLQRLDADARDDALHGLFQWIDALDAGRFPGLYLVVTGTPSFFDGSHGVQTLTPLAQRLFTTFTTDAHFDNPRAPQIRLQPFGHAALLELGRKVRNLFADDCSSPERLRALADDDLIDRLAADAVGQMGANTGVAPRLYLMKLVAEMLNRIGREPKFDPRCPQSGDSAALRPRTPNRSRDLGSGCG